VRVWSIARSEPNVLVLDRPHYRFNGGRWREAEEILRIDIAARGGMMVQPWARESPASRRSGLLVAPEVEIGMSGVETGGSRRGCPRGLSERGFVGLLRLGEIAGAVNRR